MTQYMTGGRMKQAEHVRNAWVVTMPHGLEVDEATKPEFWAHVAQQMRPRDRVELWAEDKSWFADLIVVGASRLEVQCRILHFLRVDAPMAEKEAKANSGFHVDFGGAVDLYRVIRDADGQVMTSGLSAKEAERWIEDHLAVRAGRASDPKADEKAAGGEPEWKAYKPKRTASSPAPETADTRAAVEIPDDWQSLGWAERRSLASKLTDDPVKNGDEANAAIEAELARRAA